MITWFRYLRRRWCIWRRHPTYIIPLITCYEPAGLDDEGRIIAALEITHGAVRCRLHEPEAS